MRKLVAKFLLWILRGGQNKYLYDSIDKEAMDKWLFGCYTNKGFSSYFKVHDLAILKTIGFGQHNKEEYWIQIGKRRALLELFDNARAVFEKQRSKVSGQK